MKRSTREHITQSNSLARWRLGACFGAVATLLLTAAAWGQEHNSYTKTNLDSDVAGQAENIDPNLVNGWGLSYGEGFDDNFWVSSNGMGVSTIYDQEGVPQSLVVTIPPSSTNTEGVSAPTGNVFNSFGTGFVVSDGTNSGSAKFIFVSEDGGISGWSPDVSMTEAILAVDHGPENAIYKGATLATDANGRLTLYATNFWAAKVEMYSDTFTEIDTSSTFVDPTIPLGYAPFGIQAINGSIYVSYAKQDPERTDDVPGPGHGFVSVFDPSGNFIKRLITHRPLNSPWGMALAPANFGKLSGSLLVGNFGNGRINSFDLETGRDQGPMRTTNGRPIEVPGLWALLFLDNDLYITAGPEEESHGLFSEITANVP
jgi:uncharacterized protein (TIGR03118 family)